MPFVGHGEEPTLVVFIGGFGRSGSTLLECLLSRLTGVVVLGEVEHVWQRGVQQNVRCGCREPFDRCPFWSEVGSRAFGSWRRADADRVLELKRAVVRQRKLPDLVRRQAKPGTDRQLAEYCAYFRPIYAAARELSKASVVVDSSKSPPAALALSHDSLVDLRVIHIIRDSRGVAYSWSKTMTRPETAAAELMPRYSPSYTAVEWSTRNLAMTGLKHRGRPLTRLRYEDLVDDPATAVRTVWQSLELPGDGSLPMLDRHTIELVPTHSIAGNPMRFRAGRTVLQPDNEWITGMGAWDRTLVTALTFPLLKRMGYLPRK